MKSVYRRLPDGEPQNVELEKKDGGADGATVVIRRGDTEREFRCEPLAPGTFRLTDGERSWRVHVDRSGSERHVTVDGVATARLEKEASGGRRSRDAAPGSLSSPMPGTVVKVLVDVGAQVEPGEDLLVVEAMKMEIKISAPVAGTVKALHAAAGDPCDGGQVLAEVEPAGDAE